MDGGIVMLAKKIVIPEGNIELIITKEMFEDFFVISKLYKVSILDVVKTIFGDNIQIC